MSPSHTMHDTRHTGLLYTVVPRDRRLSRSSGDRTFNRAHGIVRKRCRATPTPTQTATFARHVPKIIGVRTEPQMLGVDTGRIVARMAHMQRVGNVAMGKQRGHAMGVDVYATWSSRRQTQHTLSVCRARRRPRPTRIAARPCDLAPKPVSQAVDTTHVLYVHDAPKKAVGHAVRAHDKQPYLTLALRPALVQRDTSIIPRRGC